MEPIRSTRKIRGHLAATAGMLLLALALLPTHQSRAEGTESAGSALEEVVVTAQRRNENIQSVPISVSVLGGDALEAAGADGLQALANRVPGLQLTEFGPTDTQFVIRGVTTGRVTYEQVSSASPVALYLDDMPIDVQSANPNLQMFDMERIEVLRGPQGTLYGAGAMSGAIKLLPKKPDLSDMNYSGGLTLSSPKNGAVSYNVDAMLNLPIADDKAAIRAVAYRNDFSGYLDNVQLGRDHSDDVTITGGRLSFRGEITPRLTVDLLGIAQNTDVADGTSMLLELGDLKRATGRLEPSGAESRIGTLSITYDSDSLRLTSATGYQTQRQDSSPYAQGILALLGVPASITPLYVPTEWGVDNFTQEVRIQSLDAQPLQWIAGVFYGNAKRTFAQVLDAPGIEELAGLPPGQLFGVQTDRLFQSDIRSDQKQLAVYAEGTLRVAEAVDVTVGLRYFDAKQETHFDNRGIFQGGVAVSDARTSESDFNPKASISYSVTPQNLVYVQASKGFRLGGPNYDVPLSLCGSSLEAIGLTEAPKSFKSDSLWNYELGSKNTFGAVRLNGSIYYIDWKDIQTLVTLPCGYAFTQNYGSATSKGAELELEFQPLEGLTFSGSLTYIDSTFKDANPGAGVSAGDRVPFTPELTGSIAMDLRHPVGNGMVGFVALDANYVDTRTTAAGSSGYELDSYSLANFRTGLEFDNWQVYLYVNNMSDERAQLYKSFSAWIDQPGDTMLTVRPRTIGITVRKTL